MSSDAAKKTDLNIEGKKSNDQQIKAQESFAQEGCGVPLTS